MKPQKLFSNIIIMWFVYNTNILNYTRAKLNISQYYTELNGIYKFVS